MPFVLNASHIPLKIFPIKKSES